jgi:hypothetical protein
MAEFVNAIVILYWAYHIYKQQEQASRTEAANWEMIRRVQGLTGSILKAIGEETVAPPK